VSRPGPEAEDGAEEPMRLPLDEALDLHTFAPRDVADVVTDYLEECRRLGLIEVRLIHGRGTGTQRAIVRGVLARHPAVDSFQDAPPEAGGWGATIVRLRPGEPGDASPASAAP
jgi:dsDNA-specific endonuclease/ATPase MutS2